MAVTQLTVVEGFKQGAPHELVADAVVGYELHPDQETQIVLELVQVGEAQGS
ncbi:hypothetical protein N9545_05415 [Salibacteraceae bacterium]|nr:hypothetical protein [Salibacteraceae bacterium]MDB9708278.1 hypothetical protein [Salibacteraceae bacterium]MDC1304682.1 hypothetical protein [Salibacteraceae bacterium]